MFLSLDCGEQAGKLACLVLGQKNKPASLLVVFLGKALNGMPPGPPPICGTQVAQFFLQEEGWWKVGHLTVITKCHEITMQIGNYLLW